MRKFLTGYVFLLLCLAGRLNAQPIIEVNHEKHFGQLAVLSTVL